MRSMTPKYTKRRIDISRPFDDGYGINFFRWDTKVLLFSSCADGVVIQTDSISTFGADPVFTAQGLKLADILLPNLGRIVIGTYPKHEVSAIMSVSRILQGPIDVEDNALSDGIPTHLRKDTKIVFVHADKESIDGKVVFVCSDNTKIGGVMLIRVSTELAQEVLPPYAMQIIRQERYVECICSINKIYSLAKKGD